MGAGKPNRSIQSSHKLPPDQRSSTLNTKLLLVFYCCFTLWTKILSCLRGYFRYVFRFSSSSSYSPPYYQTNNNKNSYCFPNGKQVQVLPPKLSTNILSLIKAMSIYIAKIYMCLKKFAKFSLEHRAIFATIFSAFVSLAGIFLALLLFAYRFAANDVPILVCILTWARGNTTIVQIVGWSFVVFLILFVASFVMLILISISFCKEVARVSKNEKQNIELKDNSLSAIAESQLNDLAKTKELLDSTLRGEYVQSSKKTISKPIRKKATYRDVKG
jgi:hypothetical protein